MQQRKRPCPPRIGELYRGWGKEVAIGGAGVAGGIVVVEEGTDIGGGLMVKSFVGQEKDFEYGV